MVSVPLISLQSMTAFLEHMGNKKLDLPKLSEKIDLVFCRGVIQHTENPKISLKRN